MRINFAKTVLVISASLLTFRASSEGSGQPNTPPDDSGKSLWQIAQEVVKGIK